MWHFAARHFVAEVGMKYGCLSWFWPLKCTQNKLCNLVLYVLMGDLPCVTMANHLILLIAVIFVRQDKIIARLSFYKYRSMLGLRCR